MEPPGTDGAVAEADLVSRSVRVPAPPFRALLDWASAPRTVWDAPDAADEATVVGSGSAATLTADGPDRFETIRRAADSLFTSGDVHAGTAAARPRLFGGFAFHDRGSERPPWTGFPGAQFVFPRVQVTYPVDAEADASDEAWLTVNAVGPDVTPDAVEERLDAARDEVAGLSDDASPEPPGIASRTRTTPVDDWREGVRDAVERIRSGDLRKVVLAQALEVTAESDISISAVLDGLGESYPDCYRFLVEPAPTPAGEGDDAAENDAGPATDGAPTSAPGANASFFGATPERLVSLRGRTVETGALAGTTGRGDTPAEDDWLAEELRNSEKNVHEHELVAETIRDQLAPLASSVTADDRTVRRLATVQHLFTPIRAELAADGHVLSLVRALHPTPAVGGLPPEAALDAIRETEPFDRGWYAAPVGWIDAAGYGTFAVALRSAVVAGDTATLFAGVGIVADSDPDREWDEVQLKYRPILDELERDE